MSDTVPTTGRWANAGGIAVEAVRRIAAVLPARVAAERDGVFVTYGRLQSTVDAYRLVTDSQGMDEYAALVAALMHCLPGLAAISDPAELAAQIDVYLDAMVTDTAG